VPNASVSASDARTRRRCRIASIGWLKGVLKPLYLSYRRWRWEAWRLGQDFRNRHAVTARNITRRNSRRAYERVYRDQRLLDEYLAPARLRFYDEVADACAAFEPRWVVDVGCGTGHLLAALSKRVELERAVGVDHAIAGLARGRELVPSAEFVQGDIYGLRLPETFDLVVCTEVLEHLRHPQRALETLVRLRADGGVILATVPDGRQDEFEGHVNFWGPDEFRALLSPFGEATVSVMDDGGALLGTVRARPVT
jgi:SAM-dependent methyltransferase